MRSHRSFALTLTLLIGWLFFASGAQAEVSATLDRDRIVSGETLSLAIRVDSVLGVDDPDLRPLNRDFEVLGTSRNSRVSIVNGSQEGYTEWLITLAPKREGVMQIPPINVDGETTDPIPVMVRPDDSPAASNDRDIIVEVDLDKNSVHVQEQILVTVRLLHAINLNRGAALDELEIDNAVVRKLGENSYRKVLGNRTYGVFERTYAVFPQASGKLDIPALGFQATIGGSNSFFSQFRDRGQTLRLRSEPKTIKVLPPEGGVSTWLPARNLSLVETWDKNPDDIDVGESLTRTITITADGLTAAQIAPLPAPDIDGLRFYPDQAQLEDRDASNGVVGTRTESAAVIAQRSGRIELPPIEVRWWNTIDERFETAVVPGKTMMVRESAAANAPASADLALQNAPVPERVELKPTLSPGPPAAPSVWILTSALLALCCAFACWRWYRLHRQLKQLERKHAGPASQPNVNTESECWKALTEACRQQDAAATRKYLKQWAQQIRPDRRISSIGLIPRMLAAPELEQPIQHLLGAGYAANGDAWDGQVLCRTLEQTRERLKRAAQEQTQSALPPLYAA